MKGCSTASLDFINTLVQRLKWGVFAQLVYKRLGADNQVIPTTNSQRQINGDMDRHELHHLDSVRSGTYAVSALAEFHRNAAAGNMKATQTLHRHRMESAATYQWSEDEN